MNSGSFKNVINKIIYLMYVYKKDLALNNLQWLICHKMKPNQTNHVLFCLEKAYLLVPAALLFKPREIQIKLLTHSILSSSINRYGRDIVNNYLPLKGTFLISILVNTFMLLFFHHSIISRLSCYRF